MNGYTLLNKAIVRTPVKGEKLEFSVEELRHLFSEPAISEALFLASPNLHNEFQKWKRGQFPKGKEEERLITSLTKYALRIHNRPTPFGLFATCATISSEEVDFPHKWKNYRRVTRLDMHFSCALALELSQNSLLVPYLHFSVNSSLYRIHDQYRFVAYSYKGKKRVYQINAVDADEYLTRIIQSAEGKTIHELATLLTDEDITLEEAEEYIRELIHSQILISELEPEVTGNELLQQLIKKTDRLLPFLGKNEAFKGLVERLKKIDLMLRSIDAQIGNPIDVYPEVQQFIESLGVPLENDRLFQTDLFSDFEPQKEAVTDTSVGLTKDLLRALKVISRLSFSFEMSTLRKFREQFTERYEQEEIPLSLALDTETGIGYAGKTGANDVTPIGENIYAPYSAPDSFELKFNRKQHFLFQKLLSATQNGDYTLELSAEDVKQFDDCTQELPYTLPVVFKKISASATGFPIYFKSCGGSSAVNLLGRFGVGDETIRQVIEEIGAKENELAGEETIIATIAHLPESRTGNVLLRPATRTFEIPYLSNTSVDSQHRIDISDLYISVRNNRIVLRSQKWNKEVLPRLDNAHNYATNSLPVYHFLCDLQLQQKAPGVFFDWGPLKHEFLFLPRVTVGNVIVYAASWTFPTAKFSEITGKNGAENILGWRKKWRIPENVLFVKGDNELPICFTNKLSVDVFLSEIKGSEQITLKEFFPSDENAFLDANNMPLQNECVLLLSRSHAVEKKTTKSTAVSTVSANRNFAPGSEWVYFKCYCGVKTTDKLLAEKLFPLVEKLIADKKADSWFFIRYNDPEPHLRIRLHATETKYIGEMITAVQCALEDEINSSVIWKLQLDTYKREWERYGAETMELSEQLFFADSKNICRLLRLIEGTEGEEIRWLYGLKSMQQLTNLLLPNPEEQLLFAARMKMAYAKEFHANSSLSKQLDKRFREKRSMMHEVLFDDTYFTGDYSVIQQLLDERQKDLQSVATAIRECCHEGNNSVAIMDLLASYIHMHLNRLFRSKQRFQEMIEYDFFHKMYKSKAEREKQLLEK